MDNSEIRKRLCDAQKQSVAVRRRNLWRDTYAKDVAELLSQLEFSRDSHLAAIERAIKAERRYNELADSF